MHVQPEQAKVDMWIKSIDVALEENRLVSSAAAKLAGRLLFARSAWFGRVGSAQLRRIFNRAHGNGSSTLSASLRRVLLWWKAMLSNHAFHLQVKLTYDERRPILMYTDATGNGRMGYACYGSNGILMCWSMLRAPPLVGAILRRRKTQVTAWETIAPLWALFQEAHRVRQQHIWLFVDNVGAQFVLQKGASKVCDINAVCAAFWLLVARLDCKVDVIRLKSIENPAGAPSRGLPPHGVYVSGRRVEPVVPRDSTLSGADLRALMPTELL